MKLEIGPGTAPLVGYQTLDVFPHHNPTYCFDINTNPWPIKDNSFEEVIAVHVFEHLMLRSLDNVLNNIYRILEPNGRLIVHVPNGEVIAEAYLNFPDQRHHVAIGAPTNLAFYGSESEEEGKQAFAHKILFDSTLLIHKFYIAKFRDVKDVSNEYTDRHDIYWEWMSEINKFSLKVEGFK